MFKSIQKVFRNLKIKINILCTKQGQYLSSRHCEPEGGNFLIKLIQQSIFLILFSGKTFQKSQNLTVENISYVSFMLKLTDLFKNLGFTWMLDVFTLGGRGLIGQAGSNELTLTSRA